MSIPSPRERYIRAQILEVLAHIRASRRVVEIRALLDLQARLEAQLRAIIAQEMQEILP
jgi:hypothetical protein